ncbi:hypothetical protein C7S16_4743 [Burkholderia thailandensis]|uniref:Uncharacterized protein n=1 Tax=Burkholderia thailandensis TaxID=57975 RepID=A0AAW9CTK4_BURTH|nr:hypothetical protein [Burkholderia thailandensis]MDW9252961.1 hypothetical protein [Burkholderia thailandensis]
MREPFDARSAVSNCHGGESRLLVFAMLLRRNPDKQVVFDPRFRVAAERG